MARPMMAAALLALCGQLFGCTRTPTALSSSLSPLAGRWTGKSDLKERNGLDAFANALAGGPLTGPSSLDLRPDGTGFLKVADSPERPITWKAEGDRVLLAGRSIAGSHRDGKPSEGPAEADTTYVGRLSGDGSTLVIDLDKVKVTLTKDTARSRSGAAAPLPPGP